MSLEIFHSGVQNRYNEENQLTSHLENKAGHMLFITSLISLLTSLIEIQLYVIIPTILIAILFCYLMRLEAFSTSINPNQFFTTDNKIINCELNESIKEAKEEPDKFIIARIKSYLKCTAENKIINAKKTKYLKFIQYLFISQICILVFIIFITYIVIANFS